MNGDADLPQRSSSPLKRRASSMDPETTTNKNGDAVVNGSAEDVEMTSSSVPSAELPRAMSVDIVEVSNPKSSTNGTDSPTQPAPLPSLTEQVKIIETLLKAAADSLPKEGDKAYLVSRTWVDKALSLRSGKTDTTEASLGPIDNSDIIEEVLQEPGREDFIRLKPGLDQQSFELFPEDAWKLVMDWYGLEQGQKPIVRTAINTGADAQSASEIVFELHPPIFRVHRVWSELSPLPIESSLKADNPPPLAIARSRKYRAQTFIKDIKKLAGVPIDRKIRLWVVNSEQLGTTTAQPQAALTTPPDSPGRDQDANGGENSPWSHLLVDVAAFGAARDARRLATLEDQTVNPNYNGSATIQHFELVTDQALIVDELVDKGVWVSICTSRSILDKAMPTRTNNTALSKSFSNRSSPSSSDGPATRGRMQKKKNGRSLGAVGLHNLGNTCYMNSALQCVRSVEELTKYFLTEAYATELNKSNPLGYNGKVAMAYNGLLREIYDEGRGSVSPRDFKNTVGRCRSTFAGWGQQDSQEFLGFLLDALQEDLSRIKKKPYIEKPDSTDDMINNPEAIKEMADKVWDITRKRDDSIIADLFTGMYKSTLKCPECGKISITFDPFNNLTLPLPVENMWSKTVKFFPLNDVPVMFEVELPKHSSIESLKLFLSIRTGVPANRIMGAEEFKDRFFKIYDNSGDISEEIGTSDIAAFHELEAVPTNWPAKGIQKKPRSMLDLDDTPPDAGDEWNSDPRYETMVVPVFHRRPFITGRGPEGTSPPHFITLTREEASSYEDIKRKVLEKVSTFSTWSKFSLAQQLDPESPENTESDIVITNASDADSSGDSKVVAKSVEGEDDMVDVAMKDARSSASAMPPPELPLPHQPQLLRRFNAQRPKFVQPGEFLDPELQGLFELSYFASQTDGPVPTGWGVVDNHKTLPRLTDRIPEPPTKEEDEPSPESWNSTASGNEDSSNEDESPQPESPQTRMMDESSEDEALPGARQLARSAVNRVPQKGSRKKFKNHKAYNKKGNKRRDKQMRGGKLANRSPAVESEPTPPAVADGGPLIRLHEGLVVDWSEEAWETVFGYTGKKQHEAQGAKTFADLETINDPALKISQRKRQTRRSRGITLEECLDEFERAEVLSEQDMWYCPRCKEHRRASKKFDLWKTPDYLIAHLKRFSSSGWRRDKLDVLVDFPIEGLDLTSRVIQKEDGKEEIYDLIAVDDHYGGLGGGHYTAYAKNFVDGRWYNYNDSSVSSVSDPSSVVTSAAYLLFYRRRTHGHLGGPRFGQIFEKYNSETSGDDGSNSSEEDNFIRGSPLKAGVTHTAIKPLSDSHDGEVPPYEEAIRSIEDENSNSYQVAGPKSLDLTQSWSFSRLDGSGAEGSTAADYASDDAQFNSSGDEHGSSADFFEADTHMTSASSIKGDVAGEAPSPAGAHEDVLTVPTGAPNSDDSDEVAEIHLEGDKTARDE